MSTFLYSLDSIWSFVCVFTTLSFKMNFKTKGNYYVGQASSPESTANICVKIEVYNCLNGQLYKDKFPVLLTFYILSLSLPVVSIISSYSTGRTNNGNVFTRLNTEQSAVAER